MTDLFDDMVGGGSDLFDRPDANAPLPALGLIVAEKAIDRYLLAVEADVFKTVASLPLVVFEEEDLENSEPYFSNAAAFAERMACAPGIKPTEAEALAWVATVQAAAYAKHLPRLKAAYDEAVARRAAKART